MIEIENVISEIEALQEEAKQHVRAVQLETVRAFHSGREIAFDETAAILREAQKEIDQ